MKTKILPFLFFFFLMLQGVTSFGQNEDIAAALKAGSAEKLAKHFDNMVDVSVPGKSNTFSKGQAELVIKDFFTLNSVRNFEVQHSGSNPSSNFIIGMLTTANGTYRTTVYMRSKGDKNLLQSIEFTLR